MFKLALFVVCQLRKYKLSADRVARYCFNANLKSALIEQYSSSSGCLSPTQSSSSDCLSPESLSFDGASVSPTFEPGAEELLTSSSAESDSEAITDASGLDSAPDEGDGLPDMYEPIFSGSQLSQLTVLVMVLQFILRLVSHITGYFGQLLSFSFSSICIDIRS